MSVVKKIIRAVLVFPVTGFVVVKFLLFKQTHAADIFVTAAPQQLLAFYNFNNNDSIVVNKDSVLHFTLKWSNDTENALPIPLLRAITEKDLPVFINLEIWQRKMFSSTEGNIAEAVLSGIYDKKLVALFNILAGFKNAIYFRYNGEMELPVTKYPWQYQSCSQYINSFRHIATICRQYAPNTKMVWGPSGYPGAEEYWPGNAYVDLISINLNNVPELDNDPYPPYTSLEDMIKRKLFRMRFMDKAVILLGSPSVTKAMMQPAWVNHLNDMLLASKTLYRTPVLSIEKDSGVSKISDETHLILGVYDPLLKLQQQPPIGVEHIFTDIISVKDGLFKRDFEQVVNRGHDVIVTMEPWKDGKREKDTALLTHTIDGAYDDIWGKLFHIISNTRQKVYLRWGHEMEIPVDRYPWQKQDPVAYIRAFRYIAALRSQQAPGVKMIWGPAGDRGSVEWWPGEDVVDYVSIAIYGLPDKNINDYNKQRSFAAIFQNKLHRIRFAQRPLFITEFGVKGPETYKRKWLEEAAGVINSNPCIKGICYFNFSDTPKAWGNAETPDWSITPATFKHFISLIKN